MIEDRKAILQAHKAEDAQRTGDPILGRFMEGRAVIESEEIEWLDRLLEAVNKRI
jgi:hypothetical protein